ncbi:V-type proton ATPase subunit F [Scaptodrosophila lebanonensis]|uniref:V-type proton ATPase subunit F n=1 Tax=Drosophila lebanonensis TaxID=7225 RepID=A0A6J2T689_DROLE|nr:V-type proton ATPase subunit F [Scaptodrosophila lebanonensis]
MASRKSQAKHENPDGRPSESSISEQEEEGQEVEHEDPNDIKIGIIADNEVTLGFLLTGIGFHKKHFRNYMMVDRTTDFKVIEDFFLTLYARHNMGIILLDYDIAKRLHSELDKCKRHLPIVIVIPTKNSLAPYMTEKERTRRQRNREAYA